MTRPELLAEADRLGVMDGPKSNPAFRKRVGAARISEKAPLISQETPEATGRTTASPRNQARDLLGQPISEPNTGRQREMIFETEGAAVNLPEGDDIDRAIRTRYE